MFRIAITDDDFSLCTQIDNYLKKIFMLDKISVDDYSDGIELINAMKTGETYNIVFLDIEMPCYNGIETAKIIRELDPMENIYIIYVSSHEDNLIPLFDFHPFGFLTKPVIYEDFKALMQKLLNKERQDELRISVAVKRDILNIPINDIMYIESLGRKIILHLKDNSSIESYETLHTIITKLNSICDFFIQIHRAYIVNVHFVDIYNPQFVSIHGNKIPIGPKYHHATLKIQYDRIDK